jgi:glycosyltransferase involved in cell wall biosynthesis
MSTNADGQLNYAHQADGSSGAAAETASGYISRTQSACAASDPVRVLHLVSHPIQYFVPLYRAIERRSDLDLTVLFMSVATAATFHDPGFGRAINWNAALLDGYRSVTVNSALSRPLPQRVFERPRLDLLKVIARAEYDVLWAHGYASVTVWLAYAIARLRRKGFLLRDEQTTLHPRRWHKRVLKRVVLTILLRGASGLFIGSENRRFLLSYGARPERLFPTPYSVDAERLEADVQRMRQRRDRVRSGYGVPDARPVVLFVGKLVDKKAPEHVLSAFARVRAKTPCALLFVGDGPLRDSLERTAASVPDVHFVGFHDQRSIAAAYAAGDVFVLASLHDETWGLVVNEALASGLPVVVSDKVGCAADLVRDGWNGYVTSAGDVDSLAEALERLIGSATRRDLFGERGREIVRAFSVESAADGVAAAASASVRGRVGVSE